MNTPKCNVTYRRHAWIELDSVVLCRRCAKVRNPKAAPREFLKVRMEDAEPMS